MDEGVNRVFKDKQGGLVVDYIGIAGELKAALKEYTTSKCRGRPTVDAHEAYSVLAEKLDALRGMLHCVDHSGFVTGGLRTLAGAANFVLGLTSAQGRDGKRRFAGRALALAIRQIIGSAVVSEEGVDIFDAAARQARHRHPRRRLSGRGGESARAGPEPAREPDGRLVGARKRACGAAGIDRDAVHADMALGAQQVQQAEHLPVAQLAEGGSGQPVVLVAGGPDTVDRRDVQAGGHLLLPGAEPISG